MAHHYPPLATQTIGEVIIPSFVELQLPTVSSHPEIPWIIEWNYPVDQALQQIADLYKVEEQLRHLAPEKRQVQLALHSKPIVEDFICVAPDAYLEPVPVARFFTSLPFPV